MYCHRNTFNKKKVYKKILKYCTQYVPKHHTTQFSKKALPLQKKLSRKSHMPFQGKFGKRYTHTHTQRYLLSLNFIRITQKGLSFKSYRLFFVNIFCSWKTIKSFKWLHIMFSVYKVIHELPKRHKPVSYKNGHLLI